MIVNNLVINSLFTKNKQIYVNNQCTISVRRIRDSFCELVFYKQIFLKIKEIIYF